MNIPNNRRRRESQRRMEEVFIALLEDKELNRISVTEICKGAGVNRTTFYANYEDVYAMAETVMKHLEEEVLGLYQPEIDRGSGDHDFLRLFQHIYDHQSTYRAYFKLCPVGQLRVSAFSLEKAMQQFGNEYLQYHIEFFGTGLNGVIRRWLQNGCCESPEEICEVIRSEYNRQNLPTIY